MGPRAVGGAGPTGRIGLVRRLAQIVGAEHVVTDPAVTAAYAVDWTGRWQGTTSIVVRPGSTAEVAAVLGCCTQEGVAVVPQGGNTGLVGGGVPLAGEAVLSVRRLGRLDPVDAIAGQVTVGAGVTLAAVQQHAARSGLAVGVDLAARDTATIGGMIATNAGGTRVLRYGSMRAQVVGIEAVLADGRVITRLGGLMKDNTGYDLAGLLCGSEGTLAVVTAARLRLVRRWAHRVAALLGFAEVDAAMAAMASLRDQLPDLEAAEVMFEDGLDLVRDHTGARAPFADRHDTYLLVECAGSRDPTEALAGVVAGLEPEPAAVAVATDEPRRRELWNLRDAHTEVVNRLGPPIKLDVTLPSRQLGAFVGAVRRRVADLAPRASCVLFGHAGDGNIHVNVVGAPPELVAGGDVDRAVLELAADLGGSISAEHGIGTAKRDVLHLSRSPEEIALFRSIKRAFDPGGILNPGVLLPSEEPA